MGIVCAQKRFLTETHLQNVGINLESNFIIAGALDEYGCPEFTNLWDPEKDMIRVGSEVCDAHPDIGALMLECTGMQPFARAVQRVVDLPVFSWGTLLDYAYSVVVHRDYYGHV